MKLLGILTPLELSEAKRRFQVLLCSGINKYI